MEIKDSNTHWCNADGTDKPAQTERILARKIAHELTSEEIKKIAGGMPQHISYVGPHHLPSDVI
ncbi:hypothetical protein [Nitrosomonas sp.]|uniref:hypothetical protein n=1 Tax=Nitrosomonas sp. TaxID=42353 RepID=UPI002603AFE5|nr:hypothetical protein [Nitrosomonas sp.]